MQKIEEMLSAFTSAGTLDALKTALDRQVANLGFDAASYVDVRRLPIAEEPVPFYQTSLRPDFLETYLAEDLLGYDPVVNRAATTNAPFTWADVPEFRPAKGGGRGARNRARQVMDIARDFGYRQGFVLPLHAVDGHGFPASALISLFWRQEPELLDRPEHRPAWLRLAGSFYHERALNLRRETALPPLVPPSLTDRERECLVWACRGKTRAETADIMGVSDRTVEFHLTNTMRKLGVHSKYHAIAVAVQLRLIAP
ncbi:LuxR family transcriptional activator of conjugal transfer of Ti plasmids/LuxR family quorum-sensing system transcriptional regulator ExpR [Nitrospirillum amazonense]|uniref:LuxR family transcriptional activator of conjugal transfer of Ti plasmids/LuxR family quorum-sensing system transcriptional regulator ExpR n=1 Tax=Nitrospirillum amazonense TaxID=28077 RepID=A0A560K2W1_9PROT|nr:LuxR family transcriptional regulator [Nitrospirillum amazonense]TWB77617.1 LuxR family transcriptional activator of conjugal transfer of Ti plasmids/LuxR family quorum-sensing system transcriptional regulator ExpR [Nitrospirillum amazonense]